MLERASLMFSSASAKESVGGWTPRSSKEHKHEQDDRLLQLHSNELSTRGEESIMHDKLFFSKLFFCKFYIEGGSIMGRNTPGSK